MEHPSGPAAAARPRGRRPAEEDTRGVILAAARAEFGARGYDGATLRGIARAAGVDPRLLRHYFDGKEDLFVAAMDLPVRPDVLVAQVLAGGADGLGERALRAFLGAWERPGARERLVGLLSAALVGEAGARMVREFVAREILGRIVAGLDVDRPELRANLVASQLLGLAVARLVLRLEPVASADVDELVPLVAPALQRYLTGDL